MTISPKEGLEGLRALNNLQDMTGTGAINPVEILTQLESVFSQFGDLGQMMQQIFSSFTGGVEGLQNAAQPLALASESLGQLTNVLQNPENLAGLVEDINPEFVENFQNTVTGDPALAAKAASVVQDAKEQVEVAATHAGMTRDPGPGVAEPENKSGFTAGKTVETQVKTAEETHAEYENSPTETGSKNSGFTAGETVERQVMSAEETYAEYRDMTGDVNLAVTSLEGMPANMAADSASVAAIDPEQTLKNTGLTGPVQASGHGFTSRESTVTHTPLPDGP